MRRASGGSPQSRFCLYETLAVEDDWPLGAQERLAALASLESAMVAVRSRLDPL